MSTLGKAVALFCVGYLAWYLPWFFHNLAVGSLRLHVLLPLHIGAVGAMLLLDLAALHDIAKRMLNGNLKMAWTVVILFAPLIGAVFYLFLNGLKPREPQAEA